MLPAAPLLPGEGPLGLLLACLAASQGDAASPPAALKPGSRLGSLLAELATIGFAADCPQGVQIGDVLSHAKI